MSSRAVGDATYVILGASGNTGSIIANSLLLNGVNLRVVGRSFWPRPEAQYNSGYRVACPLARATKRAMVSCARFTASLVSFG